MNSIENYLKNLKFVAHDHAVWESEITEFELHAAYTTILPPDTHISSVRAVLTEDGDKWLSKTLIVSTYYRVVDVNLVSRVNKL